nr:MAG TPA: hypothetical protein [Caudoviricetes sp.]
MVVLFLHTGGNMTAITKSMAENEFNRQAGLFFAGYA